MQSCIYFDNLSKTRTRWQKILLSSLTRPGRLEDNVVVMCMLELSFDIAWALTKVKKDERIEGFVRDFDPNFAESAQDFLERAERFL
jgi:hypothetical protein